MYIILNIAGNKLNRIFGIGMLEKLEYLNISNNNIAKIENLYTMSNLKALYLSTAFLSRLKQNLEDIKHEIPCILERALPRYHSIN